MQIIKRHSHKSGEQILQREKPGLLAEIEQAVGQIHALDCLTKITAEKSKVTKWGGLLFSPRTLNQQFRHNLLEPQGWLRWNDEQQKYIAPSLRFSSDSTIRGSARFRQMDGLKDRVGLEIQFGKYAFMGYDIFSKMIIFRNRGIIDYGIEIVLVQAMIDCMSTGVSAFEHIMIDFEYRGEADIDLPVLVIGIGPTAQEWDEVFALQSLFRDDPEAARMQHPAIGRSDLGGTRPGPK